MWCWCLAERLANGDQRRLTGSGSASEACSRRRDVPHKSTVTLLTYFTRTASICSMHTSRLSVVGRRPWHWRPADWTKPTWSGRWTGVPQYAARSAGSLRSQHLDAYISTKQLVWRVYGRHVRVSPRRMPRISQGGGSREGNIWDIGGVDRQTERQTEGHRALSPCSGGLTRTLPNS